MSQVLTRANQYPDFLIKASALLTNGAEPIFIFGKNEDIDTNSVPEDVIQQGGLKLFPTAASLLTLTSTSNSDASGGIGIDTIRIKGLDVNYNLISEDVVLNGTTPVLSTQSFLRVFLMFGILSGTNQSAVGTINCNHTEGLITIIAPNDAQSKSASYTIPAKHALVIDRVFAGLERTFTSTDAQVQFQLKTFGSNTWRTAITMVPTTTGTSTTEHNSNLFFDITEKTDIRVRITGVSTNGTSVSASFSGLLINLGIFKW